MRRACLLLAAIPAAAIAEPEAPGEIEFQAGFMFQHPDQPADSALLALRQLATTVDLAPGIYRVDVSVNLEYVGQRELRFELDNTGDHLQPCLSPTLLGELGLRLEALPDPALLEQPCLDLAAVVPGARVDFDGSQLRLAVSIPQIALRRDVRGQVDPALWDSGINAAFVNYQASTLQGENRGQGRFDSHDLYLNSGVNLGGWRLRSNQTWRQDSQGQREWTRAYTYAQGYALLPYLRPYKNNALVLNTDRLGPDVEIENGTSQVVPRRGAVVKASFQARRVNRMVLTTLLPNGQPLPFGAQLLDASGEVLGMVGQAGQAIVTTGLDAQQATAHWGDETSARCSVLLDPSTMLEAQGYRLQTLTCL